MKYSSSAHVTPGDIVTDEAIRHMYVIAVTVDDMVITMNISSEHRLKLLHWNRLEVVKSKR